MLVKEKVLVLHSIRWKDSSKIVTLFSRERGRCKVIAKGAFRKNSPFAGLLEGLNLLNIIVAEKEERSLQLLTEADLDNDFQRLRLDMDRFPYGLAILEIINQIFDFSQSEPVYFDFVVALLDQLTTARTPEIVLWFFLLKTASFLGFKPEFSTCRSCGRAVEMGGASFSFNSGQISCRDCGDSSVLAEMITEKDRQLLTMLQSYPHKQIGSVTKFSENQNLTPLLIKYLNHHAEHQLTLNALSLLA